MREIAALRHDDIKTVIKSIYLALVALTLLAGVPDANGELGDLFASLTGTG